VNYTGEKGGVFHERIKNKKYFRIQVIYTWRKKLVWYISI